MSSQRPISITVRLYSILRQRDGQIVDRIDLECPLDSRVADVLRLLEVPEDLEVVLAINDQIATESELLHDQDRLAIIPSVAGGAQGDQAVQANARRRTPAVSAW